MKEIKIITHKLEQLTYKGKPIKLKDVIEMSKDSLIMMYRDDEEIEKLCEICNQNEAKVTYKVCYKCEEYIINGDRY